MSRKQPRQGQPVTGVGHAAVNKHSWAWGVTTTDHVGAPPITIEGPAARTHEATPLEVHEAFMLECRQLVRYGDSIAVLHISFDPSSRRQLGESSIGYRSMPDFPDAYRCRQLRFFT